MQYIYYHITEIKLRFIYCIVSIIITFLMSYLFQFELVYLITRPFLELQQKFIFVDLTEALYTIIRICICITLMLILPYIFYHVWSFFIPSCYFSERISINNFFFIFFILLILEITCIYFFLFPKICEFLLSFQLTNSVSQDNELTSLPKLDYDLLNNTQTTYIPNKQSIRDHSLLVGQSSLVIIELSARIESYVNLITRLLVIILFFFQIPFFFIIIYYNKYCTGYDLCINRKFFFFSCILFSAFISPPDIVSQLLIIFIFLLVFEFLIVLGLIFLYKYGPCQKT